MPKLGKILSVAGVATGAAVKGVRKAAVVTRTTMKGARALAMDVKTLHKVYLTGALVYELIRHKLRKGKAAKSKPLSEKK